MYNSPNFCEIPPPSSEKLRARLYEKKKRERKTNHVDIPKANWKYAPVFHVTILNFFMDNQT